MATTFQDLIYPHAAYLVAGGFYRCTCLHTYEQVLHIPKQDGSEASNVRDPQQEEIMAMRHAQHVAEVLIAAGCTLPAPDPRQRLAERAAARGVKPRGGAGGQ